MLHLNRPTSFFCRFPPPAALACAINRYPGLRYSFPCRSSFSVFRSPFSVLRPPSSLPASRRISPSRLRSDDEARKPIRAGYSTQADARPQSTGQASSNKLSSLPLTRPFSPETHHNGSSVPVWSAWPSQRQLCVFQPRCIGPRWTSETAVVANRRLQSAQNSTGIQTLLDAEQKAAQIVQKAREFRTKRVREARDEARKEIEAYKASKEAEFKEFEASHTEGNKAAEEEANRAADAKITEIQEAGKLSRDDVIKNLLAGVLEAKAVPPSKA
ncbi:vacuolar ATPase [Grosmannia clavigera kw1407]|uniref:Vacuolar ATPase n=1 Tax=Grosmannia clavigera (strain kw1407 / UAMH 11150) TaxID=655863 RepID=F0XDX9_GROCL|nr:vacuolar ATPase [Grosmannia clavigera kw1407]EFX03908.1 vacuolar ATPase [Grosmannia clavigera kw1407]